MTSKGKGAGEAQALSWQRYLAVQKEAADEWAAGSSLTDQSKSLMTLPASIVNKAQVATFVYRVKQATISQRPAQ